MVCVSNFQPEKLNCFCQTQVRNHDCFSFQVILQISAFKLIFMNLYCCLDFLIDLSYKNMKQVFKEFYSFSLKPDTFAFELSDLVPGICSSLIVWQWVVLIANGPDICSLKLNNSSCLVVY